MFTVRFDLLSATTAMTWTRTALKGFQSQAWIYRYRCKLTRTCTVTRPTCSWTTRRTISSTRRRRSECGHLNSYRVAMILNDLFLLPPSRRTLLLIMREMIGTERDYVRSLQYVIENYTQELLREDIPQALRGQRNVIFGNIERICEFHQQHFLVELER